MALFKVEGRQTDSLFPSFTYFFTSLGAMNKFIAEALLNKNLFDIRAFKSDSNTWKAV